MSKYTPSVIKNNQIKENFIKNVRALIYKVEKGKIHPHLVKEEIKPIVDTLKSKIDNFENTLGTGKENILLISEEANKSLKELKKKFGQELVSQVEESAEELFSLIDTWKDVIDGNLELSEEDLKRAKVTWARKKLLARLEELESLKQEFATNETRLEKEVINLEKDKAELDSLMLKEDNERRINEIYRKITTVNSKLDSLNVRRSNYSACFDLLDLIYANGKEIVATSEYSPVDLARAKTYLNLGKLRLVLNEPDKALSVLKRMEKDIGEIAEMTKAIDSKILNVNSGTATVGADALAYKEELMKKQRDKESLKAIDDDVETINSEIKEKII